MTKQEPGTALCRNESQVCCTTKRRNSDHTSCASTCRGIARSGAARATRNTRVWIQRFEARAEAARERERLEGRHRVESLLADVDASHRSQQIRAYLSSFRATFEKWSGPIDPKSKLAKWLGWANRYADSFDPLSPDL
jgi:hypothetical protein